MTSPHTSPTACDASAAADASALATAPPPAGTTRFLLIRHGRTEFNSAGIMQGWTDAPLTENGEANVRTTAEFLAAAPIAAAYASSLPRAMRTGEIIADHHDGLTVEAVDGLRELSFGDFDGRPSEEFKRHVPDLAGFFRSVFTGTAEALPGGESGADFVARVRAAFNDIVARETAAAEGAEGPAEGRTVMLVAHGLTLKVLLALAAGPILDPLPNASICVMDRDRTGDFTLRAFGVDPSGAAAEETSILQGLGGDNGSNPSGHGEQTP